jgi:hypothetical protein
MADDLENMFGRDSDSDPSEEAEDVEEAEVNTEDDAAPTGGGAAGGFLGQVENIKAREGEEGNEVSPQQAQGGAGAQPKKTPPRPVYEGDADALVEMLLEVAKEGEEPDIAKVRELLDVGIDVRYQVREP